MKVSQCKSGVSTNQPHCVYAETTKDDAGDWSIEMSNDSGSCMIHFPMTIRAVPGPCRAPLKVSDITFNTAHLSWGPPSDDGGSKITHYVIEKKEAGKTYWTTVSSQVGICP
mgnify:CR=1 FL=1